MLTKVIGKVIISLNDHPDIRWALANYHIKNTSITTSAAAKLRHQRDIDFQLEPGC